MRPESLPAARLAAVLPYRTFSAIGTCLIALLIGGCGSDSSDTGQPTVGTRAPDPDDDGLPTAIELAGWAIRVDRTGHGPDDAVLEIVTSDPNLADTDRDGLSDFVEYQIRSNPNLPDTDDDGLGDREEWLRWQTNASSCDSDGDCRGPAGTLPPEPKLFDGNELNLLGTSPTLADTDGDARTDYEERTGRPRHPLVAELPEARLITEGDVDLRLNVEYAESVGGSRQYGSAVTRSKTNSQRRSHTTTMTHTVEVGGGLWSGKGHFIPSYSFSHSESSTTEYASATTLQRQYSEYLTDSRNFTETATDGSISFGMRVENIGPTTFTLTNLGVTALQWMQDEQIPSEGSFRTLATAQPSLTGFTIAPGEKTPIFQMSATSVNADVVKHFLAHPYSLVFEGAAFDLETSEGIDYRFLTENTLTRTALVEIDFGGGNLEVYRVATNVQRAFNGQLAGVTLKQVMQDILQIPYTVYQHPSGVLALESVRGQSNQGTNFWFVVVPSQPTTTYGFDDIVLHAGDQIQLLYLEDADGDGLYEIEEEQFGTDPSSEHSDTDGLTDYEEAEVGWEVQVEGMATKWVYSDPRVEDADLDGWNDAVEKTAGTDPNDADTDGDGLADATDPLPTEPATRLHVWQDSPTPNAGEDWEHAYHELESALAEAKQRNENATPDDDISQIWVASGTYEATTSFELQENVAVYGGFDGTELRLGGREPDPTLNDTVLAGAGRGIHVVSAVALTDPAVLDGFTIQDAANGVYCDGASLVLRNLLIINQDTGRAAAWESGAGVSVIAGSDALLEKCVIFGNLAQYRGAGLTILDSDVEISASTIAANVCSERPGTNNGGGGVWFDSSVATLTMRNCLITQNSTDGEWGGGLVLRGRARLEDCDILSNKAYNYSEGDGWGGGVYALAQNLGVVLLNCRIWDNSANRGGAVKGIGVSLVNCSVVANRTSVDQSGALEVDDYFSVKNTIVWQNETLVGSSFLTTAKAQIWVLAGSSPFVAQSCVQYENASGLAYLLDLRGGGNLYSSDPGFPAFAGTVDLRLTEQSPCIDSGSSFVDVDPWTFGIQPLPATDLDGNPRIVGRAVDMGAYEYQGQ